ncbi:sucrose-6-phosphate hydrolase [Vibrio sinaloensis]|uniref:glycoside hydrolase family 32 protein n=1 Tax=Photobacterium sp. (strain ATCC 43367) TaxID=379097 RepID=UPI00057CC087|nr:glycoside hydrolase family 32 protein [Vibrio sinaloensis]KIE20104.1 sucrose-6-phosphate hydrolase [Vibrio sinaloensis]
MSVEHYLSLCGGKNNITRVLAPDDELIIAVEDVSKVTDSSSIVAIREVLGEHQVNFKRTLCFDEEALLKIGRMISEQQQLALASATKPAQCPHRPCWHISPPQGLLNDPNGFIFHNGEYHLFYQWYPHACVHKDKYWAHLTSPDLVNWQWQPVALTPSDWFDAHGVFSGHALSHQNQLMLFYTGNTRIGEQRDRHTTQCLATSQDGIHFTKHGPIIDQLPEGVTPHIRDPKIVRHNDSWLMLLGAQTSDLKGRLAIYRSEDLHTWQFDGLYGQEFGDFGYMWECPDLFSIGDETFAVIGPQGIESFSEHNTIPHHNGIARARFKSDKGIELSDFEHLDYGFDFYAPQTMLTPDGRRVMCGWMGLPDEIDQPSVENGWLHQLTLMRELSVKDGRLVQWPIAELDALSQPEQAIMLSDQGYSLESKSFDLSIELEWGSQLNLFEGEGSQLMLIADQSRRALVMDRSQTLNRAQDTIRELPLTGDKIRLRILADSSSVEVFVNDGDAVMTSRVFTEPHATGISLTGTPSLARVKRLNPSRAPFAV